MLRSFINIFMCQSLTYFSSMSTSSQSFFLTSLHYLLAKSASVQLRTSLSKLGGDPIHFLNSFLGPDSRERDVRDPPPLDPQDRDLPPDPRDGRDAEGGDAREKSPPPDGKRASDMYRAYADEDQ